MLDLWLVLVKRVIGFIDFCWVFWCVELFVLVSFVSLRWLSYYGDSRNSRDSTGRGLFDC